MREAIQRPVNEFSWDHRVEQLAKVKVGDKLWISESSDYPCSGGIGTVSRLTPTQIVVGQPPQERRFNRKGYRIGGGMFSAFITAIATPEEVQAYESAQQRQKEKLERREKEHQRLEALRKELSDLFADGVYVQTDENKSDGTYTVTICGLTEGDIRNLAPKINQAVAK